MAKYGKRSVQNAAPQIPSGGFNTSTYQPSTASLLDANGNPTFAGLMGQYQNAMAQQNSNNATLSNNMQTGWNDLASSVEGQYGQNEANIVAGYGQDINNVMGTLGNQQASGQQQIQNQWGAQAAQGAQNLTNLGMSGTTVAPTMAAGYQNQEMQNMNQFNTSQAALQAQTLAGLNSQDLAAQQQATQGMAALDTGLGEGALNSYGSMNLGGNDAALDASLLEQLGKSGGAGGGGGIPNGSASVGGLNGLNVPSMGGNSTNGAANSSPSSQGGNANTVVAAGNSLGYPTQIDQTLAGQASNPASNYQSGDNFGGLGPDAVQSEAVKISNPGAVNTREIGPSGGQYPNGAATNPSGGITPVGGGYTTTNNLQQYGSPLGSAGAAGGANPNAALNQQLMQQTAPNLRAGNPIGGQNLSNQNWGQMAPGLAGETAYTPQGVGSGPKPTATPGAGSVTSLAAPQTRSVGYGQAGKASNPWGSGSQGAPLTNPVSSQYGQASKMAANPMMAGFKGKYRMA